MKKFIAAIFILTFAFSVAEVYALDLGDEITIFDNKAQKDKKYGWWDGTKGNGTAKEDEEVEPGMARAQNWDLEGFFIDNWKLSMVGGFDFINGYGNPKRTSGDLFLDVDGDVKFGNDVKKKDITKGGLRGGDGNKDIKNVFGYDYVLDLNFADLTYDIYEIDETADLTMGYYRKNDTSTAWKYKEGGTKLGSGLIGYEQGLKDSEAGGFKGGSHNAASFDLSFLGDLYPESTTFTSHFTMSCGNDNLMGQGITPETPVATPEPGTLLLFGAGIAGLVAIIRKRRQ